MGKSTGSFAQLGGDLVVRFLDADHFLRELSGNLGRGRAVVRTRRPFSVEDRISLEIEAPGVEWRVSCDVRVVVVRDGFVGLEILDFGGVQPELSELGMAAEAGMSVVPAEKTVVAPMPDLARRFPPAAVTVATAPDLPSADGTADLPQARIAPPPLPRDRRRRPRPLGHGPDHHGDEIVAPSVKAHRERLAHTHEPEAAPTNDDAPALTDPTRIPTEDDAPPRRSPARDQSALVSEVSGTPPPELAMDELVVMDPSGRVAAQDPAEVPASDPGLEDAGATGAMALPDFSDEVLTTDDAPPVSTVTPAPVLDPAEGLEPAPPSTLGSVVPLVMAEDIDAEEAPLARVVPDAPPEPAPPEPAPPEPAVDVAAAPAEVAAPPAPQVPLQNLEALAEKHAATPQVTRGGVLRVTDVGTLLGLYLSQLRHGRITVWGPLEGEPGDEVRLKIMGPTVVSIATEVVGRVGEWVTLAVPAPEAVAEVLADAASEWRPLLEALAPTPAPVAPPPPTSSQDLIAAVVTPPPPSRSELPSAAQSAEVPAVVRPSSQELPAAPRPSAPALVAPPTPPPVADDAGPPEVPRLSGDRVVFRRKKDLAHEIEVNLKNGGLFVESPPLPIRTKRQLTVQVGLQSWDVDLQADVVFADGGKVGFSVVNAADALRALEERLARPEGAASAPPSASGDDEDDEEFDAAAASAGTLDMSAYIGTIQKPLGDAQLLTLTERRLGDLAAVERTTVLQLLEHVITERWKGVLKLEAGTHQVVAWLHEGSVAFVSSKPYDEASSVGRILINQKKLNEAGLREALEKSRAGRKSLGRALVALGHVKKSDLSTALREQMRLKLEEAMAFDHGQYEWTPWREPPGDADLVLARGAGILAHHVRNRFEAMNLAEIEALFAKNLSRPVGHDGEVDQTTQGMHLQPRELRFLELQLDGRRSLEDGVRGSPVGRLASLRLVGMGLALGFLRFTDGARTPRESTRLGVAPSQFDAVKKDLKETLHMFRGMNHFEILGVHWSAHHRTFKQAYEQVKRQYDSGGPGLKDAPVEVRTLAREVNSRIDGAFGTLQDPRKRIDYRKQLFDATERQYAADMLVKQGEVALMRGDRVGAIEALETAVELDPSQRNRQLLSTAREGRR